MALTMLILLLILLRSRRTKLKIDLDLQRNPKTAGVANLQPSQHQYYHPFQLSANLRTASAPPCAFLPSNSNSNHVACLTRSSSATIPVLRPRKWPPFSTPLSRFFSFS